MKSISPKNICTTTDQTTKNIVSGDLTIKLVANSMATNKSGQLRVYQDKSGEVVSAKAASAIAITAQGKDSGSSNVVVKVSNDGSTWVEVGTVTFTSSATETISFNGNYTHIQFNCTGKQCQITKLVLTVSN